jgi:FlaA1/EpsC-like NDP-sugar epimerase
LLKYNPTKLICLDQSETGLFYIEKELGRNRTVYCVADYTNTTGMKQLLFRHRVQVIFHAAAYKHVPLMEENPHEAVRNNVAGLKQLLELADRAGCEAFILISSDKAVNPSNIMGATKRIGELMMCSRPSVHMRSVSVRFGNVLGSQGSVVPVFQKQLTEEKQITVTHPEITRFFMTIPEAAALVLQASAVGRHGDVLVLDMGKPVRIVDLARTLIKLSGESERDVKIIFTGLRPGEKLYEELFYSTEEVLDTNHAKIKLTKGQKLSWNELNAQLEMLCRSMYSSSEDELREMMQSIVPEYRIQGLKEPAAELFPDLKQDWKFASDSLYRTASAQD